MTTQTLEIKQEVKETKPKTALEIQREMILNEAIVAERLFKMKCYEVLGVGGF